MATMLAAVVGPFDEPVGLQLTDYASDGSFQTAPRAADTAIMTYFYRREATGSRHGHAGWR